MEFKPRSVIETKEKPVVEIRQDAKPVHVTGDKVIFTGSAANCVCIIVYDKNKKEAYGCHHSYPERVEELFQEVQQDFTDKENLEMYVIGASNDDQRDPKDEMSQFNLGRRGVVTSLIKKYGFQDIKTHMKWTPVEEGVASLRLDLTSGKNAYELKYGKSNSLYDRRPQKVYKGDIKDPIRFPGKIRSFVSRHF